MLSLLTSWNSVPIQSYNVCAVKHSYDHYCAPQLCQTAARYFEASSTSDGRIGCRKQVQRAK